MVTNDNISCLFGSLPIDLEVFRRFLLYMNRKALFIPKIKMTLYFVYHT